MKKIILLLLTAVLAFSAAACAGQTGSGDAGTGQTDADREEEEEALAIPAQEEGWEKISTPYGEIRYPAALYEDLTREEGMENDVYRMKFITACEGQHYDLFTLYFGGEAGDATYLGKITGADGSENDVYVLPYDLGDLSQLDSADQDRIYAMQEALNEVLGE